MLSTRLVLPTQEPRTRNVNALRHYRPTLAPMDFKKASGKRLRAVRESQHLTLEELSKKLNGWLSPSRLSNYEQGTRQLGIEEALALGPALGVEPAHLLCVDIGGGEMTEQETRLLRNFRALPEKDRNDYGRRIEVLAQVYREPVPDERLSPNWTAPKPPAKPPTKPRTSRKPS